MKKRFQDLCRRQTSAVRRLPQRYSALPQRHPVVIPGGRFRETYYWVAWHGFSHGSHQDEI